MEFTDVIKKIIFTILSVFNVDEERCGGAWTKPDLSGLRRVMNNELYGQHIAIETVPFLLERHIHDFNPPTALMLGFHGKSGVGKTLVSRLVAEHFYKRGMNSKFVKMFNFQFAENVNVYKWEIIREIRETANECPRSLFIFDESDKMPAELIDDVQRHLLQHRRSIFIFLSNSGGDSIMQAALEHRQNGRLRNSLTSAEIQSRAKIEANSAHVKVVPFLPLEREHVKLCILFNARRKRRSLSESLVDEIADEFEYIPAGTDAYSSSGCKRVDEKVNLFTIPEL